MSSEPIERRVSYLGDRLKATRCLCWGKSILKSAITAATAVEKATEKWVQHRPLLRQRQTRTMYLHQ
jgi:hypothetical protein